MKQVQSEINESHAVKCDLAAEVLRSSGTLRLQVRGWSMLPSIWPGDTLLVEQVESSQMAEGEIILFRRERRLLAHRIVRSDRSHILTRGDSMAASDSPIDKDEVLGRVASIIRNGKRFQPRTSLRVHERAIASAVQRSDLAARVLVGTRDLLQT